MDLFFKILYKLDANAKHLEKWRSYDFLARRIWIWQNKIFGWWFDIQKCQNSRSPIFLHYLQVDTKKNSNQIQITSIAQKIKLKMSNKTDTEF